MSIPYLCVAKDITLTDISVEYIYWKNARIITSEYQPV